MSVSSRCFRKEQQHSYFFTFIVLFLGKVWGCWGMAKFALLKIVLRFAYLRVYILNSLPYLVLQRNIVAPEGFL
jgi:hypothetical protein